MPGHAVNLLEVVTEDYVHAEGLDPVDIGKELCGVLFGILDFELGGSGGHVDQGVIEDASAGVISQDLNVIGGGETEALVGLCHYVADKNLHDRRGGNG